jgi:hypothetical protein
MMTIIALVMCALWIASILSITIVGALSACATRPEPVIDNGAPIAIIMPGKHGGVTVILVASEAMARMVQRARTCSKANKAKLQRRQRIGMRPQATGHSQGPSRRQQRAYAHRMRTGPTGGGIVQSTMDKAHYKAHAQAVAMRMAADVQRAYMERHYSKINQHGRRIWTFSCLPGAYRNGGTQATLIGPVCPKGLGYKASKAKPVEVVALEVTAVAQPARIRARYVWGENRVEGYRAWRRRAERAAMYSADAAFTLEAQTKAWAKRAPAVAAYLEAC